MLTCDLKYAENSERCKALKNILLKLSSCAVKKRQEKTGTKKWT